MSKFNFEAERELELEAINIQSIKKCYTIMRWFLIIGTIVIELLFFTLLILSLKVAHDTNAGLDIVAIITSIVYMVLVPVVAWISWVFFKVAIGLFYDVKLMRYKYLNNKEYQEMKYTDVVDNKNDLNMYDDNGWINRIDDYFQNTQKQDEKVVIRKTEPVNTKTKKYELTFEEITDLIKKYSNKN